MLWAKKNSYKEYDNEKNSWGSKIPLPPHTFSNGPFLTTLNVVGGFFVLSDVTMDISLGKFISGTSGHTHHVNFLR